MELEPFQMEPYKTKPQTSKDKSWTIHRLLEWCCLCSDCFVASVTLKVEKGLGGKRLQLLLPHNLAFSFCRRSFRRSARKNNTSFILIIKRISLFQFLQIQHQRGHTDKSGKKACYCIFLLSLNLYFVSLKNSKKYFEKLKFFCAKERSFFALPES